ncbi:HAM1 family non-canonical purine NTP pyrophosphatase [Candidatus Mancarchaeum acidiphilum]|uniref:HAM1 family non-canonical purine NTP pyrophosphatase n=1 Tax=Candidatus Mancarchaeum acidiphilum TaxID=1920749 RepID=A0A218NMZ5_9ARCH|nr:non-canonical purine NTP pyrophosphatase [Candidatus Mancarchaeum acidiphilum]ASI13826.1 HAM1 family non-canonical purine NTP pyrophosphatase [Candidatus Mancarchaeum acidiphilum]
MGKTIYLITKNEAKIIAAKSAFEKYGIELKMLDVDYPEIQADTSMEVARYTALIAAKENSVDVIREDHSVVANALGQNIPGPYANYIIRKMPVERLIQIMKAVGDWTGFFDINAVYAHPDGRYLEYSFKVPIKFSDIQKGDPKGGWHSIMMLEDENRAFSEYNVLERVEVFNKNFVRIAEDISNGK